MKTLDYCLLIIIIFLVCVLGRSCQTQKRNEDQITALQDSVHTYRNSQGLWVSERMAIVGTMKEMQSLRHSNDSLLAALAKKVTKNSLSHTGVISETKGTEVIPITQVVSNPSLPCDSSPTYRYNLQSKWIDFSLTADRYRATLDYKSRSELSLDISYKRKRWYHRPEAIVTATDNNPNVMTIHIQSVVVQKPPRQWWQPIATFGAGMLIGLAIK